MEGPTPAMEGSRIRGVNRGTGGDSNSRIVSTLSQSSLQSPAMQKSLLMSNAGSRLDIARLCLDEVLLHCECICPNPLVGTNKGKGE